MTNRFTDRDAYIVLDKYIDWYNNDYIIDEPDYEPIKKEYFKFIRDFMFIDFYDDIDRSDI